MITVNITFNTLPEDITKSVNQAIQIVGHVPREVKAVVRIRNQEGSIWVKPEGKTELTHFIFGCVKGVL